MLGLKLNVVAERMQFENYQTLSSIEKGTRTLKASELARLSRIYSRDSNFFLDLDEPIVQLPQFAWRQKQENTSAFEVEAEIDQLLTYYQLFEDIIGDRSTTKLKLWPKYEPQPDYDDIKNRADELVAELELGSRPGVDFASLLEEKLGVKILFLDLGDRGSGLCTIGPYGPAIVIGRNEAPWRRNFSMAHELFHLLASETFPLSELDNCEDGQKPYPEKLADAFAASLLLPQKSLLDYMRPRITDGMVRWTDLAQAAADFGVSRQTLLYRLRGLGKISKDTVDKLVGSPEFQDIDRNARGVSNCAALKYSTRFVTLGVRALNQGKISKGKFCQVFGISRAEFEDFIKERGDFAEFTDEFEIQIDNS
jgi:Zn-dependent peptidase ImmA (M78 family)